MEGEVHEAVGGNRGVNALYFAIIVVSGQKVFGAVGGEGLLGWLDRLGSRGLHLVAQSRPGLDGHLELRLLMTVKFVPRHTGCRNVFVGRVELIAQPTARLASTDVFLR